MVDDAHRQKSFGRALQLLSDPSSHGSIGLIVSTRPGSATLRSCVACAAGRLRSDGEVANEESSVRSLQDYLSLGDQGGSRWRRLPRVLEKYRLRGAAW